MIVDKTKQHWGQQMDELKANLMTKDFQIFTSRSPNNGYSLTHKSYVDYEDKKRLSKSGGTMTGDLDMENHNIIHTAIPSSDRHVVNRKYVTNWSLPNTIANIYNLQMDDEGIFDVKDDDNYIEYTGSNKKVEKLLNLSRKKDWNFKQDDTNKQPFFKKSTINNNFYCVQYLGSNSNNLHLVSKQDILSNQHLNFYFVYGLKSLNSSHNEVSLFKITSNETTSRPLPFSFGISY